MGVRSRKRRARRARLISLALPLLEAVAGWVRRLPPRSALRLGRLVGRLLLATGVTGTIVRRNLAVACGRPPTGRRARAFERRYYEHLGLMLVEFLRLPLITRASQGRFFVAGDDRARVRALFDEGAGLICVAGHAGNWELAGHVAGLLGLPLTSVAKLSGHPGLDAWVTGLRESAGQRILDVRGSMWPMKKALDRRQAIGINVDQEARKDVVFAPFFGVPAATSVAPALLHLRTRAPIAVVTVFREAPFRYATRLLDVIRHPSTGDQEADVLAITTRINAAMEAALRRHPEQWLWSHRRWRRRPRGEAVRLGRVTDAPPLAL
ncbi:MAG: lysophospholipid acyltransferase family protein [Planctomycetes bacterium]|nr:lysophospholipid acyltransferase family protein [Planctomycetota bacterium]